MSSARYAEISRLFREAADLPPGERSAFLARACGDDAALRAEVEALMAHDDAPHGILDSDDVVAAALGDGHDLHVHGSGDGSLPAHIGRYRIIELIGEGGMGSVFLAEQDLPRRTVALKVIRAAFVLPSARRRFERETAALARLQHPGIAQIYDAGTATTERGTCPFIAMEFVRGQPLMDFVREHSLDVADRVRLVIDICLAVQHAHDQNIVHRDIKPSNVLVTPEGKPKLLDFGIARMADEGGAMATLETRPGQIIGTLPYMSPEQFTTHPVIDARSDIYALGVLLFEVLTGALPRELGGRPIAEAVRAIADEEPRRLGSVDRSLRGDLETIVASCLERDPARRYASAHDLARDLERHLEDQPIVARRASATYQLAKYARRNRVFVSFVVLAMIVLIGGAAASIIWGIEAERARERADAATVESGRQASIARGRAYVATIAAAAAAIDAADMATASRRLGEIDEPLRGTWEYRHLAGRIDDASRRWQYPPAPVLAAASIGAGSGVVATTWDDRIMMVGDDLTTEVRATELASRGIALAVVADRRWAIVGCIDGHLRAIQLATAAIIDLGAVLEGPIYVVRLSADAQVCVACDRDRSTRVCRLDWSSPEAPSLTVVRALSGRAASVSPDGERVALNFVDRTDVVAVRDGAVVVPLGRLGAAWSTAFSPDGARLLVGHDDGSVRLWRLPDAAHPGVAPELAWMQRYSSAAMRVAFSPDGRSFAIALWNGMIATWDIDGRPIVELRGHADVVEDLAWTSDSKALISCGQDHTVRRWDARRTPLDRALPRLRRSIVRARLTSDGARVVVSTRDRFLHLFDAVTCEQIAEWTVDPIFSGIFALAPDDLHVYAPQMDCSLGRWDLATRTRDAHVVFDSERIDAVAADAAGRTIAVGLTDGRVLLLDATTLATIREVGRLPSMVRALVFAPDGATLLGGSSTGEVVLWTLDGSAAPRTVAQATASVTGVAISPDGKLAYASSSDQSIRAVWLHDAVPGPVPDSVGGLGANRVAFTATNASPVLAIAVSPDGTRLFGGLANGRLSVWDARTGDLVLSILSEGRSIESIALDRSGKRLVTGSTTGLVRIIDQPSEAETSQ